jgi:putative transposase
MPKKRNNAEQAVTKLRRIDVLMAQGRTVNQACKEAEIVLTTDSDTTRQCATC